MFKKLNIFILFLLIVMSFVGESRAAVYEEFSVGKIRTEGAINSKGVKVLSEDGDLFITQASGTTVPADATAGYAKGCIFYDTNVATGVVGRFENLGTASSCKFRVSGNWVVEVPSGTAIATTGTTTAYCTAPESCTLTEVSFAGTQGIGSSTSPCITFSIVNLGQAGNGSTAMLHGSSTTKPPLNGGLGDLGTNTARPLTLHGTAGNLAVVKGDRLQLNAAVTGTLGNTVTFPTWMLSFGGP